jgi:trk system potassium uptake protein TrkH
MGKEISTLKRRLKSIPPVRLIVGSFLVVIVIGTILLALPAAARDGRPTPFVDALFTSTSAVCVTGLVLYDTWSHWNEFGQVVILCLIQIGGLGLVTFTTGFSLLVRRKLGFRTIRLATENTSGSVIHITRLIRMILAFTFFCEIIGAGLLMLRLVPKFGNYGIWVSFFTAVSAFCNAGFDIMGCAAPGSSLTAYAGDPLVCLTVGALVVIGGLGFVVISDFFTAKLQPRLHGKASSALNFHSKIVLRTTAVLLILGTVLFFILEFDNTLGGMNFGERLNAAFFQSVSARTAGFNTIPIGREKDFTKLITIILMFIGASPASTGGGVKTTTIVVLLAAVASVIHNDDDAILLKHRLDRSTVYRALSIVFLAVLTIFVTTGIITGTNSSTDTINALFEATSAFGTVGLSTGVTPTLTETAKAAVICTMFIGRVGPVSLSLAFTLRKGRSSNSSVLPEGRIVVG